VVPMRWLDLSSDIRFNPEVKIGWLLSKILQ
jgi:hypothetical protein